jgi:hypothetical protein
MEFETGSVLCENETKAAMRSIVCRVYREWSRSLVKVTPTRSGTVVKGEHGTVYSLPATLWEFEQSVAAETLWATRVQLDVAESLVNLRCFEYDPNPTRKGESRRTFERQQNSRAFMLNDEGLYPNFYFNYSHEPIHENLEAERNFFAWFDWMGNPSASDLKVALDPHNFVHNSVVFVTWSASWRRTDNVPQELLDLVDSKMKDGDKPCYHTTDAVEEYLLERTGNKVKCIVSIEYNAQGTPMMLIGLTNSRSIIDARKPERVRIPRTSKQDAKENIRKDLRTFKYTREEIMERHNVSLGTVRAVLAWVRRNEGAKAAGYKA